MKDLAIAYIEYLHGLFTIKKPTMPTFNVGAYNDSEYQKVVAEIEESTSLDFDLSEYEKFLKGE